MARDTKKSAERRKPEDIETHPDGWDRFKDTMDKIVPPKRRPRENQGGDETKKPGKQG